MTFDDILAQIIDLLKRQGRVSYSALKRRFDLNDDYLNDLLAFMLHAINYDPQYGAEMETRGDWLASGGQWPPTA